MTHCISLSVRQTQKQKKKKKEIRQLNIMKILVHSKSVNKCNVSQIKKKKEPLFFPLKTD